MAEPARTSRFKAKATSLVAWGQIHFLVLGRRHGGQELKLDLTLILRYIGCMNEITRLLKRIDDGEVGATDQLLLLVYEDLRKLAFHRLKHEAPGQTLQPTALVHEAYMRLVSGEKPPNWNSKGHFFAAAAEAMRRILIEKARSRKSQKHGGNWQRWDIEELPLALPDDELDLIAIDEVLERFENVEPRQAQLVKLRCFVGMTITEAAEAMGISVRTATRDWTYARAWLQAALKQ